MEKDIFRVYQLDSWGYEGNVKYFADEKDAFEYKNKLLEEFTMGVEVVNPEEIPEEHQVSSDTNTEFLIDEQTIYYKYKPRTAVELTEDGKISSRESSWDNESFHICKVPVN